MTEIVEEVIETPEAFAECCQFLAGCSVLGMDTEFVGEETYHPSLCLVQVAAPGRLFLIDPFTVGPLDAFWALLLEPERVVVVHAGREEVRLCRQAVGKPPINLFDLQLAAGLIGLAYPLGHASLVGQVLGCKLAKGETLTEWRRRPLTPEQVQYAFDDVRYLLAAHEKILTRLTKLGRVDWAREECERLMQTSDPESPQAEERWRKIKGAGALDRKRLAVVRALFRWREERAAKLNRPARTVVRDDLLVEIARRNPTKGSDLKVIRGLAHRDLDDIVVIVQEARALPPEQWPTQPERDQGPAQLPLLSSVLMAVLGDHCNRHRLAASLVASNGDVRAIVRRHLQGHADLPAIPLSQGWRAQQVLPDLLAVLNGRKALRIDDTRSEMPFTLLDLG